MFSKDFRINFMVYNRNSEHTPLKEKWPQVSSNNETYTIYGQHTAIGVCRLFLSLYEFEIFLTVFPIKAEYRHMVRF